MTYVPDDETTLYDLFAAFDPDRLLHLGEDPDRKAGRRLYEKQKISVPEWIAPQQHLRFTCDRLRVELANTQGTLLGVCQCGGKLDGEICRHLFTALFTIANLLDDNRFRVLFRNNKFHEALKRAYWESFQPADDKTASSSRHPKLLLHLDEDGHFRVRLTPKAYAAFEDIPNPESLPLYRLIQQRGRPEQTQQELIQYLNNQSKSVPLSVDTPQHVYPKLKWNNDFRVSAVNIIEITDDDRVLWHHTFHQGESESPIARCLPLPPKLALDVDQSRLGTLEGYFDLDRLMMGDPGNLLFNLLKPKPSVADFNQRPLTIMGADREQALSGLCFRNAGGTTGATPGTARLRVELDHQAAEDRYTVNPVIVTEDELPSAMQRLYQWLREVWHPRSPSLNRRGRRPLLRHLMDVLFLFDDPDDAKEAQEKILQRKEPNEETRRRARDIMQRMGTELLGFQHIVVQVHDGRWTDYALPIREVGFALAVAGQLLEAKPNENWVTPQFVAPPRAVKANLPAFLAALTGRGIELRLNTQPVREVRLDMHLNAGQRGGIDWFELHPEIRFEGRLLSEAEWVAIVTAGGAVQASDGLAIVAAQDVDVLDRLRRTLLPSGQEPNGEPVRVPRLQMLEWIELERKGVRLTLRPKDRRMVDALYQFESVDSLEPPQGLCTTLRAYQQRGYDWLAFLYQHRFGACLADDMGLGKTVQAIALLGALKEGRIPPHGTRAKNRPHLVVAPSSLVFNWHEELTRFYPDLRVLEYVGPDRKAAFKNVDVVLTTYGILARDSTLLARKSFHVAIFDEAQALKNLQAGRTAAAREVNAAFTLCLTGTPMENHIGEYYAIMDLALPGLLGTYRDFTAAHQEDQIDDAVRRTRPFILRRTKDMILQDLPPKVEQDVRLDLNDLQRDCYTRMVAEIRSDVADAYESHNRAQAGIIALSALMRLRQICVSPALLEERDDERSPKIEYLLDKLQELQDEGHAALVFSQFTSGLDLVETALSEQAIDYVRLDGRTPTAKRKQIVNTFQAEDGPPIFLISLKAGGVGLNLTRAGYVFHLDPWWNPAVEQQATDRAHRIGQRKTVFTTRLIMRHTIEEKMEVLKQQKAALFQAVVGGSTRRTPGSSLTREDFEFLIG